MITIIFAKPGIGKSALMTYFMKMLYESEGNEIWERSCEKIRELNRTRRTPLSLPDKPPIYSNYKARYLVGYEEYFEPYYVNGYYVGVSDEGMDTLALPPGSVVFMDESKRYYDSRKSSTFPERVSRLFEIHRHNLYNFYLAIQRAKLIDLNIRELSARFIEVQELVHEKNWAGGIERTTFKCREFGDWRDVELYLESGTGNYQETQYVNEGDIFEDFDSYAYAEELSPKEGKDYDFLRFLSRSEIEKLPPEKQKYYKNSEPKEFRGSATEESKISKRPNQNMGKAA